MRNKQIWILISAFIPLIMLWSGCCSGYGYEPYGYSSSYNYKTFVAMEDSTEIIYSIKYEVKNDSTLVSKKVSPLTISYLIPTCFNVRTNKKTYNVCLTADMKYSYSEDHLCNYSNSSITYNSPKIQSIEGGTAKIKSTTKSDYNYGYYYGYQYTVYDTLFLK